ncbi:ABC transporter substrate-binding protein [Nocardioides sp. CFH 31398]|uniref:ABC transporter substrate-binding protein n=1 Tax=Nocardioides sp. CFH 31398 TaxID=2919579 RepID=UPI001F06F367|nr:ABC transporter substrate-binding protein [Nocardioides sp. CFH 31398]MCH1867810.1 ABC transporter substrate-binding protein [Nocardioides sp. CFH 31398]
MTQRTSARRLGAVAAAATLGLSLTSCASGSSSAGSGACASEDGPLAVGHLNYYTGAFADVGPFFEGIVDLFAEEVINADPPLGREWEVVHDDIGTVGEASVARNFLQREQVDILLNPAHEYGSYREFMLQQQEQNDGPLMPSVHGGSIEAAIGGTADEPLFRGSPMDTAQAVAAVLQAQEEGAQTIAVVATQIAGSQLQKDAAVAAAEELGMDVVEVLDVQPEQPSYRSTISTLESADPDALMLFSQAEDGGTMVKQAAEAGLSLYIVGSSEWLQESFPRAATMGAIEQHQAVLTAATTQVEGPAFDFLKPLWESSEYAELGDAQNSYVLQYYDLMVTTALAIEQAGSACASDWTEAMYEVSGDGGTKVSTYEEGIAAIRDGEDIDYEGVTGSYDYTETGIVSGTFGAYEWASETELELVNSLDGGEVAEIDEVVTRELAE